MKDIEVHLCQSAYAAHATALILLASGIRERQHVGDALEYRIQDIEAAVQRTGKADESK